MDLPGYRITKVLGAVYGVTVRSRNIVAGLAMVLKSMAGGELQWFTSMLWEGLRRLAHMAQLAWLRRLRTRRLKHHSCFPRPNVRLRL
jgi:uncharacterized protein YbjQ (UPF0145 family)